MNKMLTIVCLCLMLHTTAMGQCASSRYISDVFLSITVDSLLSSSVYNLKMDVYQPVGDTLSARPLIILAHGGTFVGGSRTTDVTVDSLCVRFARRGYVTVSIDYRLSTLAAMADSATAVDEVIKAVSDGKAAIRYFVKDAATINTYKIDTNNIFIGGNSAGAVLYMHVGYLETIDECPSYIAASMAANGGFEGNSGNPGYTTKSKGIINLAGALNEPSFVGPNGKPSVNAQGDIDLVVPYNCGYPLSGIPVTLCGLGVLEPVYSANSVYHMSHVFHAMGHIPWASDAGMLNTVDSMTRLFLYTLVCTGVLATGEVKASPTATLYPNPAGNQVSINTSADIYNITLTDQVGRIVYSANNIGLREYTFANSTLTDGVYFIKISFTDGDIVPIVRTVVIMK